MNKDEALKIENSDFNKCTKQELFEYIVELRTALEQPAKLTRLEVIDNNGRAYVNMAIDKLEFSYQDEGRTLKIFTNGAGKLQPAQEPVAWMAKMGSFTAIAETKKQLPKGTEPIPLYTHPHQWQGLTDAEKTYYATYSYTSKVNLIDEIEQALKEKNPG